MNRASTFSILIALISISALGVAATTLETTLTTDPEDEINPDWNRLPVGEGDAEAIRAEIEGESETGSDRQGTTSGQPSEATDRRADGGAGSGVGLGTTSSESTLLGRLLALLAAMVPLIALIVLSAVVYRYRESIRSLLKSRTPESIAETGTEGTKGNDWPMATPSNTVDRAWVALVRQVNPDRPETMTSVEFRTLARERGLDARAVDSIVTAFERVHYGGIPIAEEASRARNGLRLLEEGNE